jgi:hypothetical protein
MKREIEIQRDRKKRDVENLINNKFNNIIIIIIITTKSTNFMYFKN